MAGRVSDMDWRLLDSRVVRKTLRKYLGDRAMALSGIAVPEELP
jgi:hypothetical protein